LKRWVVSISTRGERRDPIACLKGNEEGRGHQSSENARGRKRS